MTSGQDELAEIEDKIKRTRLSTEARERARHELETLRQMSPISAEATVVRDHLDWLLSIPWNRKTKLNQDLARAQEILDNDHYGLTKVKERIVEHLAVQHRVNTMSGPILCLVGPPGVGKTSLGQSIARAMGRAFVSLSLAGVRDEAEIRGHPRTFVGSMPGKVIQSMRRARSSNPLFLLDGVDRIGAGFPADPASALLDALDPEQNHSFRDHYLEIGYDLSEAMFIATANTLDIPPPLLECMEIVRIAGYGEDEKVEIARKHLIPRAIAKHGLEDEEWAINDDALLLLIRRYTREAGVRDLERELASLIRKALKELVLHTKRSISVDANNLAGYLGVPKVRSPGTLETDDLCGLGIDARIAPVARALAQGRSRPSSRAMR
jgi:ATP-dependent Lon protease